MITKWLWSSLLISTCFFARFEFLFIELDLISQILPTVLICPVGNLDVKGLFQSVSKKDYMTYCMLYLTEKSKFQQRERNKKYSTNVSYMTFIADMAGGTTSDMFYKPCKNF